jgi:protein TonB
VSDTGDKFGQSRPQRRAFEGPRALNRHAAAIPTFDARWLIGIIVFVPIVVTAGVYQLHHQPLGPQNRAAGPVVEVRLLQEPAREPAPVIAPQPEQEASLGRPETLVDAPNRPIPEEAAPVEPAPPVTPAQPSVDQKVRALTSRRAVPSGAASAYQRLLLSHIYRYLRYPAGVEPSQMHGVVQVVFAMQRDGTVMETWVRTSSGHLQLDEAATETIRRAEPLPRIPPGLPDKLTILLPVSFDAP